MSRKGLMDRVRSWFGAKVEATDAADRPSAKRCALRPPATESGLALPAIVAAGSTGPTRGPRDIALPDEDEARAMVQAAMAPRNHATKTHLDPMNPEWMDSFEELPHQIAQSMAEAAAGTRSLERIAGELQGHRQQSRALLETVQHLPNLSANQARIAQETNRILERQLLIMESTFDSIVALRAGMKTMEETSRRQVAALAQLEGSHRGVLFEYQAMLQQTHRHLVWLTLLGIALAAGALGGVAYVAWRVLVLAAQ